MKTFELVSEDDYEKVYLSKKHNLKVIKNGYKVRFVCTLTDRSIAEMVGADDDVINSKLKEYIGDCG